jgi:hypothetical protein
MRLRVFLAVALAAAGVSFVFAQDPSPIITLRRTSCYGPCPVYSVEIFEDGFIRYVGTQFVQYTGEQRAVVSRDVVEKLVASFARADYFALKDSYDDCRGRDGTVWAVTDLPTTYTSLLIGTRKKSVRDYVCAPKKLKELELEIDRVANTKRWIGKLTYEWPAPIQ